MDIVQIALCDTCRESVMDYSRLLRKIAIKNKINIEITEFYSAEQLMYEISVSPNKYKICFLNVVLGKMNGIELADHLKNMNSSLQIIFTASGTDRIFDTFKTNPIDFIDKDTATESDIEIAFMKAIYKYRSSRTYTVYTSSAVFKISAEKIEYFEIRGPIVLISCNSNMYCCCEPAAAIEKALPHFISTSNNFIVNPEFIERIERYRVVLSTGHNIPLDLNRYYSVKEAFTQYLLNNI